MLSLPVGRASRAAARTASSHAATLPSVDMNYRRLIGLLVTLPRVMPMQMEGTLARFNEAVASISGRWLFRLERRGFDSKFAELIGRVAAHRRGARIA